MAATLTAKTEVHSLECMEIWGGNSAADSGFSVSGVDAWILSRPYRGHAQGGDIHYVSMCGGAKISRFVIADVAGHGEKVGAVAMRLRGLMKKYINTVKQARFARKLNVEFSRLAAGGTFATALLATYYAPTDHLAMCNAGHPPPLWYRSLTRRWQYLKPDAGVPAGRASNLPFGIGEPSAYVQFAVPLEKGDLVVLYTDSLWEAVDDHGRPLGDDGLLEMVRGIDAAEPDRFQYRLLEAVDAYSGGRTDEDDVTVLVLHHNGERPPRQTLGQMVRTIGKMVGVVGV
jgi:serine phosphatase RsbU (regulator of sigma subunit)